ncbi:TetR/AcrR family transcriptional regulator [Bradyrhizobium sp. WSM 1738]|uniref:TetR/AcrR family transcriptional regulator n=1 Tax=Bradyrhizobium hereditatis TaxID=2821405 RepID=UPI001CE3569B|nr:TetR/AcrR family transcriptional regulator [Bradyrhizobium hereditatis]MCA6113387.1 TetR/AcrR family transcriptional regulator [Bradyrhizobium hereditatis]
MALRLMPLYEGDMTTKPRRATYRHGNLKTAALKAATRLVASAGHEQLSLREVADAVGVAHRSLYNHFADREALLDAVATEAYTRLAAMLVKAETPEDYTAKYVRFALANRALYALMTSRPHRTMKFNPPLQAAVHKVIAQAMRIFCQDIESPAERRRAVMKVYITLYGGISLYTAGVLDQPSEKALIAELSAMNAGK